MLKDNELREIIRGGKNISVEFKTADVRVESLAREMVAFANSQGGVIILGVDDDGAVTGLTPNKDYQTWVMNIARNNVVPPLHAGCDEYPFAGQRVAVVTIERGKDKPY